MVDDLNKIISDPKKQFTMLERSNCDIQSSLRCAMSKRNIPYILIETSGQQDIQPLDIRVSQVYSCIDTIVQYLQKN